MVLITTQDHPIADDDDYEVDDDDDDDWSALLFESVFEFYGMFDLNSQQLSTSFEANLKSQQGVRYSTLQGHKSIACHDKRRQDI